eukprot:m.19080 g.19080  ORF g.19080 m.19080 type:complete len:284 (+) comp10894_c0_seq1:548-1399(+)
MSDKPVIIITGATSGIGRSAAPTFAKAGYRLILAARRTGRGNELVNELKAQGHEAIFVTTNVGKDDDVKAMIRAAESNYGRLDVIFSNAGYEGNMLPLSDPALLDTFDDVFNINVRSLMRMLPLAIPLLEKTKGCIFATSSAGSIVGLPTLGSYAASKAALDAVVRVAAAELASAGIRVFGVNPYVFASEMGARAADIMVPKLDGGDSDPDALAKYAAMVNPSQTVGTGDQIASLLLELIAGKHAEVYPSGSNIAVDAGPVHFPLTEVPAKFAAAMAKAPEAS